MGKAWKFLALWTLLAAVAVAFVVSDLLSNESWAVSGLGLFFALLGLGEGVVRVWRRR